MLTFLPYLPYLLFLVGIAQGIYFNTTRLVLMGVFLILIYGYLSLPHFVLPTKSITIFGPAYFNSQILVPLIIPLTFCWIHFTGQSGLLTGTGPYKLSLILLEILLLAFLYPVVSEFVTSWLSLIPQIRILGGRLNLPLLSLVLTIIVYLIMFLTARRNYYSHNLILLFWLMLTAELSVSSGLSWRYLSFPMHHAIFLSGSGLLYNVKILDLARGKAYRDQLTQIPNRMALDEYLLRLSGQYAICRIDIDGFRDFNETYGSEAGDKVLQQVAGYLQKDTSGRAFRSGGGKFTVVYPGKTVDEVEDELENVRKRVADNKVKVTRKSKRASKVLERKITISLGLADSDGDYQSAEDVLSDADNALFRAEKDQNRLNVHNGQI